MKARHIGIAALLGLLLGMLSNALPAQEIAFIGLGEYAGITTCTETNQPLILLSTSLDSTEAADTRAHEEVHVRQVMAYPGGCKAAAERYRTDPQFRFDQELEAYCVSLNIRIKRGHRRDFEVVVLAIFMRETYPTFLNFHQVWERVNSC